MKKILIPDLAGPLMTKYLVSDDTVPWIAVTGGEGLAFTALVAADVVVPSAVSAPDLLLGPVRLFVIFGN